MPPQLHSTLASELYLRMPGACRRARERAHTNTRACTHTLCACVRPPTRQAPPGAPHQDLYPDGRLRVAARPRTVVRIDASLGGARLRKSRARDSEKAMTDWARRGVQCDAGKSPRPVPTQKTCL